MNQLPENSLRIYDVTLVTSYLIGLGRRQHSKSHVAAQLPEMSFVYIMSISIDIIFNRIKKPPPTGLIGL